MKTLISFFVATFSIVSVIVGQRIPPNKPVIVKVTSTECNVCGLRAWDELKEVIDLYEKEAVIMAVHPLALSLLFSETSLNFIDNMPDFFGTPSFYVNRTIQPFTGWLGNAKQEIEAFQKRQTIAHPSINYTIEGSELKVEVHTEFFKKVSRPYYISVFVLEDEITETQVSRGPEDKHAKVLRTHIGEAVFGLLFSEDPIEVNQKFVNNYELTLEETWNPEHIEIAVIIWEKNGDEYIIVNSNAADNPLSLSTSTNFLETSQVEWTTQPNILVDNATVNISLPIDMNGLNLSVVNILGQKVHTVFSGDLNNGIHFFTLNRNDFDGSGLYFLIMEKAGSRLVQKIILK